MSQPVPFSRLRGAAVALAIGLGGAPVLVAAQAVAQTAAPATRPDSVRLQPASGDYVTVGRTNLRQQPSQQGARIALIESGVRLKVTGKVADAPWYAVMREDGRSGYVFADLLRPVAADPAPSQTAPTAAPAVADPVGTALSERLDKMDAALADIRKRVEESAAAQGVAERQQTLESAIAALRDDIAGLRSAAAEGDKPGGFMDRLIGLQEQISTQIAEQKGDLERLGKRLDTAEEWLKPVKEWSDRTLDGLRPGQGWADWFWNGYAATWSWLTGGWWWQEPAGSVPAAPSPDAAPPPVSPLAPPASNERRTIMG